MGSNYSLYDHLGKEVITGVLKGMSNTIDVGDLSKGVCLMFIFEFCLVCRRKSSHGRLEECLFNLSSIFFNILARKVR